MKEKVAQWFQSSEISNKMDFETQINSKCKALNGKNFIRTEWNSKVAMHVKEKCPKRNKISVRVEEDTSEFNK